MEEMITSARGNAPNETFNLKHYQLRGRFAGHGHVEMLEAWDSTLQRKVAIKRIPLQTADIDSESLIKEARMIAGLRSTAMVKIHAIEESGNDLYLVMEWIEGESLQALLQSKPFEALAAFKILLQIAEALEEAHAKGLVYGDLKSSNVFVNEKGRVHLAEFGMRHRNDQHTITTIDQIDAQGSVAYMAPELFNNELPTSQCDVFSLGTIFYEMLLGQLPFAGLNGLTLVAAQVQTGSDQWPWPEHLPVALRDFILQMTARHPTQRLRDEQIVAHCRDYLQMNASVFGINALNLAPSRLSKKKNILLLSALIVIACSMAGWQSRPYWPQIVKVLTPYSESHEMEVGIADLTRYMYTPKPALLESASEHFSNVLSRSPDNAKAVGYMALVYLSQYTAAKRDEIWLQKAKASAQQAMKLDSQLASSLVAHAKILHWHHKLDLALEAANKALVIEPKNLFAWHSKMSTLYESNRYEEAILWAEQGSKIFPEDRFLLDLKSAVHFFQHDYQAAEEASRMSLKRQPDSPNAYALLADTLEIQGRSQEALQILQQGLQVSPNAFLYATLGEFKFARGEFEAAAAAFANAVSPEKGVAGSYYRWAQLAEALMWVPGREGEGLAAYDTARKLLEIRLNRSPDDDALLVAMSVMMARLGDFKKAKALADQTLVLAPDQPDRLFQASLTYELIGERRLAVQTLEKAKKYGFSEKRMAAHPILKKIFSDLDDKSGKVHS